MQRQVIITADDFGRNSSINAAVIQAHRQGILTSASLMVTGDAVEEAVALAKETPTLAVGLHLVVVDGRSALPPERIPHLVDASGRFSSDLVRSGLFYFINHTAQRELAEEMAAQFARFAATGLPLTHVDGHTHMHVHPTIFRLLLPLAQEYGAKGIRIPQDDFWLAVGYNKQRLMEKAAWALAFGLLCRWCRRRLYHTGLVATHRVYGLMQTGRMEESYVIRLLQRLDVPTAELYFHPSLTPGSEPLGPNPGDLTTLLSPRVRQVLAECKIQLTSYASLAQGLSTL